jgi:Na+/H+ antiporter NhaD/arsenite permease-like protein
MLIGQSLHLSFAGYLLDGCVPAAGGLLLLWWILCRRYRDRFPRTIDLPALPDRPLDRWQTGKGFAVLAVLVVGLVGCPLPHEVQALLAAGIVLSSRRMASRDMLAQVDWQLLVLFAGLFIVNHAVQAAGHAAAAFASLREAGLDIADPACLFATSVLGSNLIGNVPLTMLLLPVAHHPQAGAILALGTTLAGNLLLVGSIANLIVVEQARQLGVQPRGRSWAAEHLRTGLPITATTLAIAGIWLWVRS